jgi:hypothetical protein
MPTTSRGYPYPNPGDPADVPADIQALATALNTDVGGITPLIQAKIKTASVTANSTTEVVIDSITWTAVTGESYMLMYDTSYQGTIVGDILELRMRYKAGATVDATGTQFGIKRSRIEVANSGNPLAMHRVVTGIAAGQTTIGVTINRQAGTGVVQATGTATDEGALTLVRVLSP